MKFTETLFIPAVHKFGLSTSTIWDCMERDITFVTRVKPDWDKIPESEDVGLIIRNGKHAGIQLSHEDGWAYVKGIVWTEVDGEEVPFINLVGLGSIDDIKNQFINIVFNHSHEKKTITMQVGYTDWSEPFTNQLSYEGGLIDYTQAWLWVGCNMGLPSAHDKDKGFYKGEIDFAAGFKRPFTQNDFMKMFPQEKKPEFDVDNWKQKNPIFYCDFKTKTPYKYKDLSGNGNNICVYREEWGDMF